MKKNRLVMIEYRPPPWRCGRFIRRPKDPQVQVVTKKDAERLRYTYVGAPGLGARRVIIAKIESDEEVE